MSSTIALQLPTELAVKNQQSFGVEQGCVLAITRFHFCFNITICMALCEPLEAGTSVEKLYLQCGKLVGNHGKLTQSVLVTA